MARPCQKPPPHTYIEGLAGEGRDRYNAKVAMCGGMDPLGLSPCDLSRDASLWPSVDAVDISDYLVRKVNYLNK